ncbi:MAG: GGDEF domain-containing protein, partial [Clostridia bacterium]
MKRNLLLILVIAFSVVLLLGIAYVVLTTSAREQAYRTASVLADQIESILKTNKQKEASLVEALKENYIAKAKAVAYIIDKNPEIEASIAEQIRVAKLMAIDEIHIFDETGTIVSGTVPIYYGFSFDSGEQMAFFKPMLENKALSMCQDVTPNTAEGKSMMYAICWNDSGSKMIQIGIEPVRLLEELRTNQISQVIADLPAYEGIDIIVADSVTGEVVGSTTSKNIGRSMKELGIDSENVDQYHQVTLSALVNRVPAYCLMSQDDEYTITIVQKKSDVNQNIPMVIMTMFLYLLLAVVIIFFVVRNMNRRLIDEHKNANTDQLTGLPNRRAYEIDSKILEQDPRKEKLVYGVFD